MIKNGQEIQVMTRNGWILATYISKNLIDGTILIRDIVPLYNQTNKVLIPIDEMIVKPDAIWVYVPKKAHPVYKWSNRNGLSDLIAD